MFESIDLDRLYTASSVANNFEVIFKSTFVGIRKKYVQIIKNAGEQLLNIQSQENSLLLKGFTCQSCNLFSISF